MQHLEFHDLTEVIPAFTVIVLMSFTYNIGIGYDRRVRGPSGHQDALGRMREVPAGCGCSARCRCCSLCSIRIKMSPP